MGFLYRAHGLLIHSPVRLPLSPASSGSAAPDLTLKIDDSRPVPDEPAPGVSIAELQRDGVRVYSFGRAGDRTVLRYPGLCDLVGDRELSEVTVHFHPGADREILGVLASGNLLAVHLILRRQLVLHASAVCIEDRTVAFVGASGMGKSTLAAAYCAAGAALVTDDVLRVQLEAGGITRVHAGATENRLRTGADPLGDAGLSGSVRRTADGRLALHSRRRVDGSRPLAACVVPILSPDVSEVSAQRLHPAMAMRWLLAFPKVPGWCEPESTRQMFQSLGDLVERVPVLEARIPMGLPLGSDTLSALWRVTAD